MPNFAIQTKPLKILQPMETTPSMTLSEAFRNVFNAKKNYSNYTGRARRSEFWYTTLICVVMLTVFDCLFNFIEKTWGQSKATTLVDIFIFSYFCITNYSCLCRRMHDIGRSCLFPGLTLTVALVAFTCLLFSKNAAMNTACTVFTAVAALLLAYTLFLCTKDSDKGKNRYGYSDKYIAPMTTLS